MRIEEVIGERVAEYRRGRGWPQAKLAEEVSKLLDKPWSRQAVNTAEHGRRAFTASELVALAHSLGVKLIDLFYPDPGARDDDIELTGDSIDASAYRMLLAGKDKESKQADLMGVLVEADQVADKAARVREDLRQFILRDLDG